MKKEISILYIYFVYLGPSHWGNSALQWHYNDVIMCAMASQITGLTITQAFIQAHIKENIKTLRHWPLWGEFTDDRWIPRTKGQ